MLERLGRERADRRGIDRLPERFAEPRIAALPQRAGDLSPDQDVDQRRLIAALPDAGVLIVDQMVDAAGDRTSCYENEQPAETPHTAMLMSDEASQGTCHARLHADSKWYAK